MKTRLTVGLQTQLSLSEEVIAPALDQLVELRNEVLTTPCTAHCGDRWTSSPATSDWIWSRPDRYSPPPDGVGFVGSTCGSARLLVPRFTAMELKFENWPLMKPLVPSVTSLAKPATVTWPFSAAMLLKIV